MFHPSSSDGIQFLNRKDTQNWELENHDKANQVRLLTEEMFLSARNNSDMFLAGNLYRAHGAHFGALPYVGASLADVYCLRQQDSDLSPTFSAYRPSTHYSVPVKSEDLGMMPTEHGFVHTGLGALTASAIKEISRDSERQKKFESDLIGKQSENRDELKSNKPPVKKEKEQPTKNRDGSKGADEIAKYWERRRRNNASAKRSRDTRRARELQTHMKAAFIEKENIRILAELVSVRQENVCLRKVLNARVRTRT